MQIIMTLIFLVVFNPVYAQVQVNRDLSTNEERWEDKKPSSQSTEKRTPKKNGSHQQPANPVLPIDCGDCQKGLEDMNKDISIYKDNQFKDNNNINVKGTR